MRAHADAAPFFAQSELRKLAIEAASKGDLDALAAFDDDVILSARDADERSALHRAVAEGHAAAAARLCEERAGVAVRLIACKDAAGWGPMHTAAAKGLAAAVRAMAVVVSAHARELLESESQDAGGAGAFVLLQAD